MCLNSEYQHVSGIIIMIIKRNSTSFIIESSYYWNPLWAWRVLIKSLSWGVVGGGYSYGAMCNIVCHPGENNISITVKQQQRLDLLKHYSSIARWGEEILAGLAWYLDLEKLSLSLWPQLSIDWTFCCSKVSLTFCWQFSHGICSFESLRTSSWLMTGVKGFMYCK